MYEKILRWLEERKSIQFETEIIEKKWAIVVEYKEDVIAITPDNENIRIEYAIKIPLQVADKEMIKGLYVLSYDKGLCIRQIYNSMSFYVFNVGFSVPEKVLTKRAFFHYLNILYDYSFDFEDFIEDYAEAHDSTILDLSMFTSDDFDIGGLNLDMLVHLRETKFNGSWKIFKDTMAKDNSEKGEKLADYISRCIEFEEKNDKDLADVYGLVKEELITIINELSSNDIIYS